MSQKSIILSYLRDLNDWTLAGKVRSIHTKFGFIGFRGDRTVRDLVEEGVLERRMNGKYAEVRVKLIDEVESSPPKIKKEPLTLQRYAPQVIEKVAFINSLPAKKNVENKNQTLFP